jgi:hypothetical protein
LRLPTQLFQANFSFDRSSYNHYANTLLLAFGNLLYIGYIYLFIYFSRSCCLYSAKMKLNSVSPRTGWTNLTVQVIQFLSINLFGPVKPLIVSRRGESNCKRNKEICNGLMGQELFLCEHCLGLSFVSTDNWHRMVVNNLFIV